MKVCWRTWERGLVMIAFGRCRNVLRKATALTIQKDELDVALGIVEASIKDIFEDRCRTQCSKKWSNGDSIFL